MGGGLGGGSIALLFYLTAALEVVEWSTSFPARFTPEKENRCPLTVDWMGPRAELDMCGKYHSPPGFHSRTVSPYRIATPIELTWTPIYRYELLIYCYPRNEKSLPTKRILFHILCDILIKCGKILLELFLSSDAI
jgi:hypothetical protein